jgi:hypothetical protein
MTPMFEAAATEFPFVEDLTKREKSKVLSFWDQLKAFKKVVDREGNLLPLKFAAKLLSVSPQRVDQLVEEGRIKRVEFAGHVYVTENSLLEFAKLERRNGRPPVTMPRAGEIFRAARETVREMAGRK